MSEPTGHVRAGSYVTRSIRQPIRGHVFARDGFACRRCGATEDLTIDHVIPRVAGGTNHFLNVQTLCDACNRTKGNAIPEGRAA
jgi:5-methylcytosine-specific restriction endonuclease McrA